MAESICKFDSDAFEWLNNPSEWNVNDEMGEIEGSKGTFEVLLEGSSLRLQPPAKKDFWSKTFYSPLLIKSDASALLMPVPLSSEATIGITFEYTPVSQFDQAGLLVYIDDNHWMKCGIEFCDGISRLSVVVCNNYSDWSTQTWGSFGAKLKIHKVLQSDSVVVEASELRPNNKFEFIRIAHISSPSGSSWTVGPYAASPIAQKGCAAIFTDFYVGPKENSSHSSEL